MSVNDLTGTTWLIDETPTIQASLLLCIVNFSSGDFSEGTSIDIGAFPPVLNGIMYVSASSSLNVYSPSGGWVDEAYRTISITGGTDATNATLIAWLEANATQVVKYVNKVLQGSTALIDLTADTVTASDMLSGVTAHDRSGAPISGTVANGDSLGYGVSTQPLVGTARVGATEI